MLSAVWSSECFRILQKNSPPFFFEFFNRIGQEQTLARQSFTSAFGTKQSLTRPMKIEYNAGLGCFKSPSTCEISNQKFRHLLDQ
jgi:hypothetical protein